uniref:Uncharacterized protein n=1 Tax=Anopheles dirus TaxID=7168 RepID=A0A182N882_9DIPT
MWSPHCNRKRQIFSISKGQNIDILTTMKMERASCCTVTEDRNYINIKASRPWMAFTEIRRWSSN